MEAAAAKPVVRQVVPPTSVSLPTLVVWGRQQLVDNVPAKGALVTLPSDQKPTGLLLPTVQVFATAGGTYNLDIASPKSLWYAAGAKYGVDPLLIYAVALVESRSVLPGGQVAPTPWLVRIDGDVVIKGNAHDVSEVIVNALANDQAVQDVGLMQVYWPMHRDIAPDPVKLINPVTNIDIGTQILAAALRETSNPVMAVGYYHSHTTARAEYYGKAVYTVYHRLQKVLDRSSAGNLATAQVSAIPEAHVDSSM